jgi:hypothetical protein
MSAELRQPPVLRQPGISLALLLGALLIVPFGHNALAATKSTTVKPATMLKTPVQSAATGSLKSSRQALLKQRTSVISPTTRHPGKIVGTSIQAPKTIVTKRFLPK